MDTLSVNSLEEIAAFALDDALLRLYRTSKRWRQVVSKDVVRDTIAIVINGFLQRNHTCLILQGFRVRGRPYGQWIDSLGRRWYFNGEIMSMEERRLPGSVTHVQGKYIFILQDGVEVFTHDPLTITDYFLDADGNFQEVHTIRQRFGSIHHEIYRNGGQTVDLTYRDVGPKSVQVRYSSIGNRMLVKMAMPSPGGLKYYFHGQLAVEYRIGTRDANNGIIVHVIDGRAITTDNAHGMIAAFKSSRGESSDVYRLYLQYSTPV